MITAPESQEQDESLHGAPSTFVQGQDVEGKLLPTLPVAPVMGSFVRSEEGFVAPSTTAGRAEMNSNTNLEYHNHEEGENTHDQGTDEEAGIIRCICLCDDDDGFTIQCDRCLVWQHCACLGMSHSSVPDEYLCEKCDPRPVNVDYARAVQRRRLQQEAQKSFKARDFDISSTFATNAAAAGMMESAANAATESTLHGTKTSAPRRKSQHSRSPTTRPIPDRDLPDDMDLNTPHVTRSRPRNKRSRSGSRKSLPTPSRHRGSDDENAHTKLESWQVEFSPTDVNQVRESTTMRLLAQFMLDWHRGTPLTAAQDDEGFFIAPLRFMQDSQEEASSFDDSSPDLCSPNGLAAVRNELVPVAVHCSSLSEAGVSLSVRSISDHTTNNFFNNIMHVQPRSSEPQKIWSASKMFCRPSMHGLFADTSIPPGAFIMEYRGELYGADTYRANRINQYDKIGTTKPHVQMLPHPLNMVIDARMYGNIARFARSSCHPNAVLRPIFQYSGESDMPKLAFGLFAIAPIPKSHEVTLGWNWDDNHIVHVLPALVRQSSQSADDTSHLKGYSVSTNIAAERGEFPYVSSILANKCNAVVSILLSYATCACLGPSLGGSNTNAYLVRRQNCAVTQMLRLSQGMPLLYTTQSPRIPAKAKPIILNPLVGVFRQWLPPVCMDEDSRLCTKIAQNSCYVQRVSAMPHQSNPSGAPKSHASPHRDEIEDKMSVDDDDVTSEAGSEGQVSLASTDIVTEEMPFESDPEDPLVSKALTCMVEEAKALLPLKKRGNHHRFGSISFQAHGHKSSAQTGMHRHVLPQNSPTKLAAHSAKESISNEVKPKHSRDESSSHMDDKTFFDRNGPGVLLPTHHIHHDPSQACMLQDNEDRIQSHQQPSPKAEDQAPTITIPSSWEHSAIRTPSGLPPQSPLPPLQPPPRQNSTAALESGHTAQQTSPHLSDSRMSSGAPSSSSMVSSGELPFASSSNEAVQDAPNDAVMPTPPAPPKRLSLAEYKKRLSSRRKSENQSQGETADPVASVTMPPSSNPSSSIESRGSTSHKSSLQSPPVSFSSLADSLAATREAGEVSHVPEATPVAAPSSSQVFLSSSSQSDRHASVPFHQSSWTRSHQQLGKDASHSEQHHGSLGKPGAAAMRHEPSSVRTKSDMSHDSLSVTHPPQFTTSPLLPVSPPSSGSISVRMSESIHGPASAPRSPPLPAATRPSAQGAMSFSKYLPRPTSNSNALSPPAASFSPHLSLAPPPSQSLHRASTGPMRLPPPPPPGPPPPMPAKLRAAQNRVDVRSKQVHSLQVTNRSPGPPQLKAPTGSLTPHGSLTSQRGRNTTHGRSSWRPAQ